MIEIVHFDKLEFYFGCGVENWNKSTGILICLFGVVISVPTYFNSRKNAIKWPFCLFIKINIWNNREFICKIIFVWAKSIKHMQFKISPFKCCFFFKKYKIDKSVKSLQKKIKNTAATWQQQQWQYSNQQPPKTFIQYFSLILKIISIFNAYRILNR